MIVRAHLYLCTLICLASASVNVSEHTESEEHPKRFEIIRNQWDHINTPYMIATWLLLASLSKILFNLLKPISRYFPDSSLLIVVGLALGALLKYRGVSIEYYTLNSHVFFIYLLPPIIFDAGYFMPNRALFENFDSVTLFAIVGTTWNCLAIGSSLYVLSWFDLFTMKFGLLDIYLFSSLISAVDPVAVIAIFEEINVNEFLFVNVFGEALFNDGVTVVLYNIFNSYRALGEGNIQAIDYFAGGCSFFVIALGGTLLGVIFAFFASFITKYTEDMKIVSTVLIFVVPYMCYLTAEWWAVSSIIAIAVCGMVMKQYVKGNISQSASSSVKYFVKMLAQASEAFHHGEVFPVSFPYRRYRRQVIFMFLGLSVMSSTMYWDDLFVLFTIIFCLFYRTIGVIVQCAFLNRFRTKKFEKVDQFILSYGGLRGAIAYGLAVSMPDSIPAKPMFVTATIAVIYFTVFLQGGTIRPLVSLLNIERQEQRAPTMTESVYNKYLDYMMSGLEDIAGQKGQYTFIENFERYNAKLIKPFLMRNEKKSDFDATKIVRAYAKITLEEALQLSQQIAEKEKENQKKATHKRIENLKREENTYGPRLTVPGAKQVPSESTDRKISVEPDMNALYEMFSTLLDQKLTELQSSKIGKRKGLTRTDEEDIEDDYMQQMSHSNQGSRSNLRDLRPPSSSDLEAGINLDVLRRRKSTGNVGLGLKEQHQ